MLRTPVSSFKQEVLENSLCGVAPNHRTRPAVLKDHNNPRNSKPCAGGWSRGRLHRFKSLLLIVLVDNEYLLMPAVFQLSEEVFEHQVEGTAFLSTAVAAGPPSFSPCCISTLVLFCLPFKTKTYHCEISSVT